MMKSNHYPIITETFYRVLNGIYFGVNYKVTSTIDDYLSRPVRDTAIPIRNLIRNSARRELPTNLEFSIFE